MGHRDKGCAGPGHRFLEEQPLPAEKREKGLVMRWIQTSLNKSLHISVLAPPPTWNHEAPLRSMGRSF